MRIVVIASLIAVAGCIIDTDPVRVDSFNADPPQTFAYSAQTNTVMTANDDGAAEQIRRVWLAEALAANGMCPAGYVIETRRFVQPWEGLFGNGGEIVYAGRCL
jgi:transcriptional regulator of nitric oxide reductase